MEPPCEPLQWTQPLHLPRAGSGEDFLWSQPVSFQDREVYGHSASVVGNTVWVLGGKNQASRRISVHCFCPKTLTWSDRSPKDRQQPAPKARWGHSVCQVESSLIIIGGFDSKHNLRDAWQLDTEDGSFTELCDDLLVFGAYHSAVFDQSTSYITLFGGQCCVNGPYEYYNEVHVLHYDPDEEVEGWVPVPVKAVAPAPRAQHCALVVGDEMVVYGGANATRQFNDLWSLNLRHFTWQEITCSRLSEAPPPVELELREQHFRVKSSRSILALHEMKLLVLGPNRSATSPKKYGLYVFDLERREWKRAPLIHNGIHWRGNAAGWVSKTSTGEEELWVHGGHVGNDTQPRQILLRLHTQLPKLVRQTIRGISALPHENLKLVFSFLSGSVADLI